MESLNTRSMIDRKADGTRNPFVPVILKCFGLANSTPHQKLWVTIFHPSRFTPSKMATPSPGHCRVPHCGKGLTQVPHLLLCSRCNIAEYCSPKCQSEDWPLHRLSCVAAPIPPPPPLIIAPSYQTQSYYGYGNTAVSLPAPMTALPSYSQSTFITPPPPSQLSTSNLSLSPTSSSDSKPKSTTKERSHSPSRHGRRRRRSRSRSSSNSPPHHRRRSSRGSPRSSSSRNSTSSSTPLRPSIPPEDDVRTADGIPTKVTAQWLLGY